VLGARAELSHARRSVYEATALPTRGRPSHTHPPPSRPWAPARHAPRDGHAQVGGARGLAHATLARGDNNHARLSGLAAVLALLECHGAACGAGGQGRVRGGAGSHQGGSGRSPARGCHSAARLPHCMHHAQRPGSCHHAPCRCLQWPLHSGNSLGRAPPPTAGGAAPASVRAKAAVGWGRRALAPNPARASPCSWLANMWTFEWSVASRESVSAPSAGWRPPAGASRPLDSSCQNWSQLWFRMWRRGRPASPWRAHLAHDAGEKSAATAC
jgi:hypothetical protein